MDAQAYSKPISYHGDLSNLPPALLPLIAEPCWVIWRWEFSSVRAKWTKVPYQPLRPTVKARSNAPQTWSTHEDAVGRFAAGDADGIGFMLKDSEVGAFDIDDCRNRETGEIAAWAGPLIEEAASYTEVTVSGTGLRIIGLGAGAHVHRNQAMPGATGGRIETYRRATRYIVITGLELSEGSAGRLNNLDNMIDRVVAELDRAKKEVGEQRKEQEDSTSSLKLPPELEAIIRLGVPVGRRSAQFHHVVARLKELGWNLAAVIDLFGRNPQGIAAKFIHRLPGEVERSWSKVSSDSGATSGADAGCAHHEPILAIPYCWTDPEHIPAREWLYGHHLIRRFVSATIAPGGVGKSSLVIVEALAMASGKSLLGVQPPGQIKVWLWNLEDPRDELTRRVQAAAKYYELASDDFAGHLFMNSGREEELIIARMLRNESVIVRPVVDALVSEILKQEIDVLTIDPFVSCHHIGENDNMAIDMVVKEWGKVADRGNCAVELIHHTRKMIGVESEVTTESSRGGKAMTDACRSVRAINRMSKDEGDRAGIEGHRLYFRAFSDKANLAPPPEQSDWFKLESINLGNSPIGLGDNVGVVVPWTWPDPMDSVSTTDLRTIQLRVNNGKWRENVQAKDWVGNAVATVLGLDPKNKAHRTKINGLLKIWLTNGMFVVVNGKDDKGNDRPFIEVGEWATD